MESRDYLEMTFKSINCFADDGTIDHLELNKIFEIALRDGIVDDNEKRVLKNIIDRVTQSERNNAMMETIAKIEQAIA